MLGRDVHLLDEVASFVISPMSQGNPYEPTGINAGKPSAQTFTSDRPLLAPEAQGGEPLTARVATIS